MTKRENKLLSHLIKSLDAIFADNRNYSSKIKLEALDFIEKEYKLNPNHSNYIKLKETKWQY